MQFKSSLVAAFLLATVPALGFTVPEGAPDGIYTVGLDDSGNELHTRMSDIPSEAVARAVRSRIMKRDGIDQYGCFGSQLQLNQADTNAANGALQAQLNASGTTVGSHASIYSVVGETVSYCCNNRAQNNVCVLSAQGEAETGITNQCGAYNPGYAYDSGAHLTTDTNIRLTTSAPAAKR